jgi:ApbE superfamily uncharacterized protein (UPF0280 family)
MNGPQAHWLEDGRRLHLNHGPIDLIVEAFGEEDERCAAYAQAVARFETILTELVAELPRLRMAVASPVDGAQYPHPSPLPARGRETPASPFGPRSPVLAHRSVVAESASPLRGGVRGEGSDPAAFSNFSGPTARRMEAAVAPLAKDFITPMAAVAGAVADEVLAAMIAGRRLERAYVNNGGDSALHLEAGQSMRLAIAGTGHGLADRITIHARDRVRGVATSGWRGRSFSLGIADAVTVLARTGAEADAAATIVANAVDLPGHPAVTRQPAHDLAPDSDLGGRLVTTGVGGLSSAEIAEALERGFGVAGDLRRRGLIEAAALFLAGQSRICGHMPVDEAAFAPLYPAEHPTRKTRERPHA